MVLMVAIAAGMMPTADAARLYLDPAAGTYAPGATFVVDLKIDTEGECVNAAEVVIKYPSNDIQAVNFGRGESLFTLWVQPPTIDDKAGTISFIGGLPGGYCGKVPGDPGATNILGKLAFRFPGFSIGKTPVDEARLVFEKASVLLNDGLGSPAPISAQGAMFYRSASSTSGESEWDEIVRNDAVSPEPFTVEIQKDPSAFDGKYFIVFYTTDKQTGLDRFEVMEDTEANRIKGIPSEWVKAESPYVLTDQTLHSVIRVKAVDKAGNDTLVELVPGEYTTVIKEKAAQWWKNPLRMFAGALAVALLFALLLFRFIRRRKRIYAQQTDIQH